MSAAPIKVDAVILVPILLVALSAHVMLDMKLTLLIVWVSANNEHAWQCITDYSYASVGGATGGIR